MPIVANSGLPTFDRLRAEGQVILPADRARHQDIRELHVGLLNMMPDKALEATERQFFRLVGESNPIAQFYMHPFTLSELPRGAKAQAHIDAYYDSFESLREVGLDALIITGANVTHASLEQESFWTPLTRILDWAEQHVTSTLCSCLATHAAFQHRYGVSRYRLPEKRWGVFEHVVVDNTHPLTIDVNSRFDVPHSRFNQVDSHMMDEAGLKVLVQSEAADVHLAVSPDGLRTVYFQGHPEYDTISLLKEFKREAGLYSIGKRADFPPFPEAYFDQLSRAILNDYRRALETAMHAASTLPEFPEHLLAPRLENTWHDTGEAIVGNWIGLVYQVTGSERKEPFMETVDRDNPLNWR
ncbi:MAG: homoserine O-succinyltransferase MetA [Thiotrichales bacterium]